MTRIPYQIVPVLMTVAIAATAHAQSNERFVPATPMPAVSGTMEVTSAAASHGTDIRICDVVHWSGDQGLGPTGDLVVDRFDLTTSTRTIPIDAIRGTLRDAGVNLSTVKFAGATKCVVTKTAAATVVVEPNPPDPRPAADVQTATRPDARVVQSSPFHTLRDRMSMDLAERLNLPVERLQLSFDSKDSSLLELSEPACRFRLDPRRVRDLGKVAWDVTITSGDVTKRVLLTADARAWEKQLFVPRGVVSKQVFKEQDLQEKRVLIDRLSDEVPLTRQQIIGQQAAYDIKAGTVVSARMIDPVPLAKYGELVWVIVNQGGIQLRTVAKAMETGSYGQSIKVRAEDSKEEFQVTLTGPLRGVVGAVPDEPTPAGRE